MAKKKQIPAKDLSFGDAVSEVEQILYRLEEGDVDIDELSAEVKRAVELIQVCRGKLDHTETEVRDLVSGLQAADLAAESTNNSEEAPF